MSKIKRFVFAALFVPLFVLQAATEREEFAIVGTKFQQVISVRPGLPLSIENEYGTIRLHFVDTNANQITVSGDYSSESKLKATIQLLKKPRENRVFIDGPARFKSHDHVARYGKPLDYAFFASAIDRIPFVRKGEEEGQILVGDAFRLQPGGTQCSGWCTFWGPLTFGRDISLDEGASLDRLPAEASLVVEIPVQLCDKIQVTFKTGPLTVTGIENSFVVESQKELRAELVKASASCRTRLEN